MRFAKTWLSVFVALLLLSGMAVFGGANAAQDRSELTHRVGLHSGTCEDFDPARVLDLGVASPNLDEATDRIQPEDRPDFIGFPGALPVAVASTTLRATFEEVFTENPPHSVVVHAGSDLAGEVEACGELGGLETDGRITISLQPVNDSGIAGLAIFDEDDAGLLGLGEDEINVAIYVLSLGGSAQVDVAAPEPATVEGTEEGYAHPEWLVDASWLEQRLDPRLGEGDDVRDLPVVGVIPREEPHEGLVPNTVRFEPGTLALLDTSEESVEEWRLRVLLQIAPLGQTADSAMLEAGDRVLLYDDGSLEATALWWALDYFGHEEKWMLNGGLEAWLAETDLPIGLVPPAGTGQPIVPDEVPESLTTGFNLSVLATINHVEASLEDPNVVLIDARSPDEYAAGHIPGAVNIPASENVEPGDIPYWADAEQLRQMYAEAGVTPQTRVIAYGGDGWDAYVTYFTLGLLGYEDVAVYPGGWPEWSQFPALPRE